MWKWNTGKGKNRFIWLIVAGCVLMILAFPLENGGITWPWSLNNRQKEQTAPTDPSQLWDSNNVGFDDADGAQAGTAGSTDAESESAVETSVRSSDSYESELEQRIRAVLLHVEGVGAVDVMVMTNNSGERVYSAELSTSSMASPVQTMQKKPEISGIVISAAGGGNSVVRSEISEAMEALFGIPAHKIKVLKRVN